MSCRNSRTSTEKRWNGDHPSLRWLLLVSAFVVGTHAFTTIPVTTRATPFTTRGRHTSSASNARTAPDAFRTIKTMTTTTTTKPTLSMSALPPSPYLSSRPFLGNTVMFNVNTDSSLLLEEIQQGDDHEGSDIPGDNDDSVGTPQTSNSSPNNQVGVKGQTNNGNTETSQSDRQKRAPAARLSRPERKALERGRQNKNRNPKANYGNNRRKHNFAERANVLADRRAPGEGRYDLHSTVIPKLCKETTTADEVLKAIKRAQNLHDQHDILAIERFLLEECDVGFAYGYRGSLLARLAVAALHMDNHVLARKAIKERRLNHRPSMLPLESAAIVRGLLRVHNVTDALDVLEDELSLPLSGTNLTELSNQERIKHRALALGSVASRHFFEGEPLFAVRACQRVAEMGPLVRKAGLSSADVGMPWARIVQGAAKCEAGRRDGTVTIPFEGEQSDGSTIMTTGTPGITAAASAVITTTTSSGSPDTVVVPCNLVYAVLNALTTFPSDNDDETYEALSNALVRRVVFVTGAVSLAGCPEADRGEAAFIGRSNVGKSSLVNMVTNRKSLAYTSKTPGKTQQFNYFAVNDKPDRAREIRFGDVFEDQSKDLDSFYIVDLPGFGFAKVPEYQRREWSKFMVDYIRNRKTLRVLFHLIDSRHGPTDEDRKIMEQIGPVLPQSVKYVVVLTKADKNAKGPLKRNKGRVMRPVLDSVREALKANRLGSTPVLLSSADSKLGRDDLWRYLKLAAEG